MQFPFEFLCRLLVTISTLVKKKIAHKPSQMSITSMYNILFLFYFVWCVCVPLGRHAMNFVTATYNKYGLTPAFHYWPNCSFVKYTNQ